MRASLDTNVIIHLYEAELQNILFMRFDEIYVYEHIIFIELKNHASQKIMQNVLQDIELGKIALVTKADLIEKGCWYIFDEYVRENRLIYEYGDLGEVYAIALARTLGLMSVVTDDIKERGPHYTLIREIDSDIIPFSFFELLFLDFLEENINAERLLSNFELVNMKFQHKQKIKHCINRFDDRFFERPISVREKEWFNTWCKERNIDYLKKYELIWDTIELRD